MKKICLIIISLCLIFEVVLVSNSYALDKNENTKISKEEYEKEAEEIFQFKDVKETHWAYKDIMSMADKGILKGMPDGNFGINGRLNKESLSAILVRGLDIKVTDKEDCSQIFDDVNKDMWAYSYVDATKNYFKNYEVSSKLKFSPKKEMTREEVANTFVLALGLDNSEVDLKVLDRFADRDTISSDLKGHMAIAVENGILKGSGNMLNPKNYVTRAEVASIYGNIAKISESMKAKEKDSSLWTEYGLYNDGYVKFLYPLEFASSVVKLEAHLKENPEYKSYNMTFDGMKISLFYTPDPLMMSYTDSRGIGTNTLNDLNRKLQRSDYKIYEIANYNNKYVLLNYVSEYGDRKHIYGRGIGKIIPQVVIYGREKYVSNVIATKSETEKRNENLRIEKIANVVRDSFSVVSKEGPYISPGIDKDVMETFPKTGDTNIEDDLTIEIGCNANVSRNIYFVVKDEAGSEIKDLDLYINVRDNKVKIKFGEKLIDGKTYIIEPYIFNDVDGNFINGGNIKFTVGNKKLSTNLDVDTNTTQETNIDIDAQKEDDSNE